MKATKIRVESNITGDVLTLNLIEEKNFLMHNLDLEKF